MRRLNDCLGRRVRTLTLITPLSVLIACGDSIQSSSEPPVLTPAPTRLTLPCSGPVILPERELTQSQVEELWLRDRSALVECGLSKEALVEFYHNRDALLIGAAL